MISGFFFECLVTLVPSSLSIKQVITSSVGTACNNHSCKSSANIVGIHALGVEEVEDSKRTTVEEYTGSCIEEGTSFLALVAFDMVGVVASSCRIILAFYLSGKTSCQSSKMTLDDIITIVKSLLKCSRDCHAESLRQHHLPSIHLIES